jgi:hypothetical protein
VRDLGEACEDLLEQLAVFSLSELRGGRGDAGLASVSMLIAEPDIEPGPGRGVPAARLPGNVAALAAELDAHRFVRQLEASLRLAVAGHAGRARGGSDNNTREALAAIARMSTAAEEIKTRHKTADGRNITAAALAAKLLDRMTRVIGQLPAVDEFPRWERIRPGPGGLPPRCPNCVTFSLRVAVQSGAVICVFPGCKDLDGNSPPQARLELSRLNSEPVLAWKDGTVQYAP